MVEGGRSPFLSAETLQMMGFKIAIFPASGFLAAAEALRAVYARLKEAGTSNGGPALYPFPEMNRLMGFGAVHEFEAKWA